jgi:hypothetical protein
MWITLQQDHRNVELCADVKLQHLQDGDEGAPLK